MADEQQQHNEATSSPSAATEQTCVVDPSPEVDKNGRRQLILIVASIAIVTVLILVVMSLVFYVAKPTCETVKNAPERDARSLNPIASQDNKALALFAGYLKFVFDEKVDEYLEMNLEKVHHSIEASGKEVVRLTANCATIDLIIAKDESSKKYVVQQIYVRSVKGNHSMRQCRASVGDIHFGFNQYYTCHTGLFYPCDDFYGSSHYDGRSLRRVTLHLSGFDLELNGNQTSISSGYFDLSPIHCSR